MLTSDQTTALSDEAPSSLPPHKQTHLSAAPLSETHTEQVQSHPFVLSASASALLAACGGGGGGASDGSAGPPLDLGPIIPTSAPKVLIPATPGFNNFPDPSSDEVAARFLLQSEFSATPAQVKALRDGNFAGYLQQEFNRPMTSGWDWLDARGYGADATLDENIYNESIGDFMAWRQLFRAPDAMRQRMALALSEFFVVSFNSMEIDWRAYTMTAYWDTLARLAFGNFRELLEAISLNPAMGYFLNTKGNQKEDGKGRLPDENYAREVMQLFTIGLYLLNEDGSIQLDGNNKKRESYTSDDVSNLARVFTGYDFDPAYRNALQFPGENYKVYSREYARRPMKLDPNRHSNLEVKFLDTTIPAGASGAAALKTALDTLFNHPNVGTFFGRQMIQRLVTSNPSPAYVARVARAFNNNGAGVRGDLRAVWTAILLDDEARSPAGLSNPKFGKLREPMIRLAQWSRSFNAVSQSGSWKIFNLSDSSYSLGQNPMRSPSVFNYFRPGYVPPGTALATSGATAPEFQIVNETTVGGYVNYMQNIIRNGMKTPRPSSAEVVYTDYTLDLAGDYSSLLALINNTANTDAEAQRVAQSITAKLNVLLCAGQLSIGSRTEITTALAGAMRQSGKNITASTAANIKLDLIAAGILMVMASPDYLIQK
jgi:uncharacterized protein (DUF1800 family)